MLFLAPTVLALLLSLGAPAPETSRDATPKSDAILHETLQGTNGGETKRHGKSSCEGKAKRGTDTQPTAAT